MLFRRILSEGLAHHSYLVGDEEAVVIDPRRDVDVYLDLARRHDLRIRYVLETHRNEDYVVGSTALAAATGATILHSRRTAFEYGTAVGEGDEIGVGRLRLRAMETPGHTEDSLTWVLADTEGGSDPLMAFTGDTLFCGDVGRTDLLGENKRPRMSEQMHESLFEKVLPLGDGVILCPAHGAGSPCGGAIAARELSTVGYERRNNPRLKLTDRVDFVQAKREEQLVTPPYFARMREWNQRGNAPIYERVPSPPPLPVEAFEAKREAGAIVLDTRSPQAFAGGHIPESLNIWLAGVPLYAGWMLPPDARILLVLPEDVDVGRATRMLLRIGYDRIEGHLRGGFAAWQNGDRPFGRFGTLSSGELRERLRRPGEVELVDVRRPAEWQAGSIPGARHIFVGELERRLDDLPRNRLIVTTCSVGNRAGLAASILTRAGFPRVANHLGGYTAWTRTR